MFEFLRRRKTKANHDVAMNSAVGLLRLQIELGKTDDLQYASRLTESFSLGYMFGFCDAMTQTLKISDDVEALALTAVMYTRLLGDDIGPKLFHNSYHSRGGAEFVRGRSAGGEELVEFLRRKTPPMSLATYLLHGTL